MIALSVQGLCKSFDSVRALEDASFEVRAGEFFTVMGPTNAGKSTLLKCIAGIEKPDKGVIQLHGGDITSLEPNRRGLSLLFQNIALFPNRTGYENIAFPLRVARRPEAEIRQRITEVAAMLRVTHVLDRFPRTFSGGEQQRIAIGRAIALPSNLLMLDEPLTNLDARIRIALRMEFKRIHQAAAHPILYVTHDQGEAMSLSDRIGVLRNGRFEQIGTPDDIYHRPATEFVARFVGAPAMNILPATLTREAGILVARGDGLTAPVTGVPATLPEDAAVAVRAEDIQLGLEPNDITPHAAEVLHVERLGSHNILDMRLGQTTVKARTAPTHPVAAPGRAWLGFLVKAHLILDRRSGRFCIAKDQISNSTCQEEQTCA